MIRSSFCQLSLALLVLIPAALDAKELTPEQIAKRSQFSEFALQATGNADHGRTLFNDQQKIACANCHALDGIEKSGPNLSGIADKYPRKDLIHHILNPNAFIQPGYETVSVLTDANEIVTGRLRLSTRLEVRLLLATGKLRSVKRVNITELKSSNVSLMPEDMIDSISKEGFSDLIAYLETLHNSELNAWKGPESPVAIQRLVAPVALKQINAPELKFENPVWLCEIPGRPGQLVILEHQQGRAIRLDTNTNPPTKHVFLDIANEISFSANQGLMCLVFHPDFENNRKYYVKYEIAERGGVILTTVNERLAQADLLQDSGTPSRRLLSQSQPAFNHNGGCLGFGADGKLYIAFGDGGPQEDPPGYSQNARVFHGSILRIDVDARDAGRPYAIPADNPFLKQYARDRSIKPETWAIGFREPWRFSFDALTGDLWVGDVGQVAYEEVCLVRAGENHGWNVREGYTGFSEQYRRPGEVYSDPLFAYPRSLGVSVTGGYVYRADPSSTFFGTYIFGDYESRRLWAIQQNGGKLTEIREIGNSTEHIASFGVDAHGNIFLVGYEGGIFQLDFSKSRFE